MKKECENCQKEFIGRSDKRFCSIACKNSKNNFIRQNTREITKEIDGYLHRNREILATFMGEKSEKEMFDRLLLVRAGFRFDYCTGIYINNQGKTYFYIYDYAWMTFSKQEVMVVRKIKKG